MHSDQYILLTIDVEDWFQVENFKPWIPFETWDQRELRVERNVHRLLDLFDSVELGQEAEDCGHKIEEGEREANDLRQRRIGSDQFQPEIDQAKESNESCRSCLIDEHKTNPFLRESGLPSLLGSQPEASSYELQATSHKLNELPSFPASQLPNIGKPKATFFVLGWIAERLPQLVCEIAARGHEVASHGYNHDLPTKLPEADLRKDLVDSKKCLEDTIGAPVIGFRAPSFAINDKILSIIGECGYCYDSSYNSFGLHGRYGKISLNGNARHGIAHKLSDDYYELPVSNLRLGRRVFPLGGGGYFRLLPYWVFRHGIQRILKHENAYLFYAHPWEIDQEQPRVDDALFNYKFRHYRNLSETYGRLERLIRSFGTCRFMTSKEYVSVHAMEN
jgi:polysaccharide deacetylase family protein (PEP-CTERM system associated)